jgi:hypothetical protein
MSEREVSNEVVELEYRISPILAGRNPEVQSAVIADLLAKWVLGFQVPGDVGATADIQAHVLAGHIKLVMDLIECQGLQVHNEIERVISRN